MSGKIRDPIGGKLLVHEPYEITSGVCTACAVAPKGDVIPVKILNLTAEDIRIHKGQKLGIIVGAEEEESFCQLTIGGVDVEDDSWLEEYDLKHLSLDLRRKMEHLLREFARLISC